MTRRYREVTPGKTAIVDILCDMCGGTTRTIDGYEKATLTASFEEGFHAGDRFIVELCQSCFDYLLSHILVDRMGTCMYHSDIDGASMEMEDLREMYAHLRSGTLIFDPDEIPDFDWDDEDGEEV